MKYLVIYDNNDLIMPLCITKSYEKALGIAMQFIVEEGRTKESEWRESKVTFEYDYDMEGDVGEMITVKDGDKTDYRIYILVYEKENSKENSGKIISYNEREE